MNAVLEVSGLTSYLGSPDRPTRAVDGISLSIGEGQTFALLGESGCGKSMTALALMRLLPVSGRVVAGSVRFDGRDLLKLSESQMRKVRGRGISMIFQEPMTSLNPVVTIGRQIMESMLTHQAVAMQVARDRTLELLDAVGIPDPSKRLRQYPHEFSGGLRQRVMIAMALACEPELLIADEPTTALDVTTQAQVLDLIRGLQQKQGMAVMLITHDLGVVNQLADKVAVMYAGQIVETAERATFFETPLHPYSQKLFDSMPGTAKRGQDLDVIRGFVPSLQTEFKGCRFASRCHRVLPLCREVDPVWSQVNGSGVFCHLYPGVDRVSAEDRSSDGTVTADSGDQNYEHTGDERLLRVNGLEIHFPIRSGVFKRVTGHVRAVDGVDIDLPRGRTLALVGESGCGKTTTGKGILQLIKPSNGSVSFEGEELTRMSRGSLRHKRSDFQIIFQDPYSSMNPRMLVGDIIAEGLRTQSGALDAPARRRRVDELLARVGLPTESADRYPHEFSGGQRQRISIARALAVNPKLIVCDEPTSALDVSVQAQILNLLKELQRDMGISYLFITHDISVVAYLAHEVAVMYLGRIVEYGTVDTILEDPAHPYTQALLSAVPTIDTAQQRQVIRLAGDIPSASNPPSGCHFHPRCNRSMAICADRYPVQTRLGGDHLANCHLYED